MDRIVWHAVASGRAALGREEWLTMVPGQQASPINDEINRLDLARAKARPAPFGARSGEPRQMPAAAVSMAL